MRIPKNPKETDKDLINTALSLMVADTVTRQNHSTEMTGIKFNLTENAISFAPAIRPIPDKL